MKVLVPGKLILSGEHAVVYGEPAIAMAVNRYAMATISHERSPRILFDLVDIAHRSHLPITSLRDLKNRIKRKYHRFIRGEYTIREVLQKPFELAHFAISSFAEAMNVSLPHGVKIHLQSDIPMGCGMGSSSATILSVMKAISSYLDIPLSTEALFELALEAENMQHGHSSGLDLRVALQGGGVYMHQGVMHPRSLPVFPWFLVNTGAPLTSTGECVAAVATHFQDPALKSAFGAVTNRLDAALHAEDMAGIQAAIRENHALLCRIGVVPARVAAFIADIEQRGGAAKICGAGAVSGESAGVVMVMNTNEMDLLALCTQYGYECLHVSGDTRGVHVV